MSSNYVVYAIDDDPGDIELLRRYLEDIDECSIDMEAFPNVVECLERLAVKPADLIFTDYLLGTMTGIDCLRTIRSHNEECPVIILTGHGDEAIAVQSMREGASDYLPKSSLTSQILYKAVSNAVEKCRLRQALEQQQRTLEENNRDLLQKNMELRMLTSAMNAASDQIVVTRLDGTIVFVNRAFEQQTGYEMQEVLGKRTSILNSGTHNKPFYADMWSTILSGKTWCSEMTNRRKDGSFSIEDVNITPVSNNMDVIEHFIAIKRNITEKKAYERKLDFLAHHDVLTGLSNRLLFNHELTKHIEEAARIGGLVGVLFIDLDRFKFINDSKGHNTGDLILQDTADRLRRCVKQSDTLARMGGDEFTIVISELTDRVEAMDIATLVLESLSEPFVIDGQEFSLTASIGISTYPDDGETAETLVRNADTAMYKAKEEGRNNFQIYTDAFNHAAVERVNLEQQLRKAIDKGEFLVRYQPQIEISSGRIVGTEALVRWQSPQLGLVSPADFIPLAEETGLIMAIGEFVMETACRQNKAWHDAGYSDIVVSVNMSARQFQNEAMLDWLSDILTTTGLDPCYLDLELTESILMKNPESMIEILQTLKDMNIGISIDDFGTGYSSLSYLKQFPVSALKIDRSFISNITTDPDDAAIARAVIAMAKSLNLKVIAEGVETLAQLSFLHELNCDLLQGYLISPPVTPEEIECMLRDEDMLQAA